MKAMIMAAGVGSRLMPLTMHLPKPMIPVGNRPLMENIIDLLGQHDCSKVIANLHYHSRVISDYFRDGSDFGVEIEYSPEEELLGTAGGVKKCEWFLNDTFVVISGDALTDIDLSSLLKIHRKKGALATIALKKVNEVEQFGVVITDENGKIDRFQEKPRTQEALSDMANTGIYIFEPEIFKYIPARQFYDFGKQVFPHLVKIGAPFYGAAIDDYWCDIGNITTYRRSHEDMLAGRVRSKLSGNISHKSDNAQVLTGKGVKIGDEVEFVGTVVIGDGCSIEDGTVLNNSIIWNNTKISGGSVINESVIGSECCLGSDVLVEAGAVVASGCILESGERIPADLKVFNSSGGDMQLEQG